MMSQLTETKPRILVVDDEIRMIRSMETLLGSHDFQVDTAIGGESACIKLSKSRYDIVLLDLNMQDLDGHAVMEFMQANSIPTVTIVVSGESSFSAVSKALRRGAYDYLKKPFDPEELLATIEKALNQKKLEDANRAMQRQLERSEELHRYLVNNSPDIVFMLDKRGCFTFLNNKIEALLGYPKATLTGKHFTEIVHVKDREKANYYIHPVTDTRSSEAHPLYPEPSVPRHFELRLLELNAKTRIRTFEITLSPIEQNKSKLRLSVSDASASRRETELFFGFYGTARDVTERKEAEKFINYQTYHDQLTRLPNRALFKDRLNLAIANARRNHGRLAVLFLDLARFKIINHTLGHAMGDRLLISVARKLSSSIREGDTLARFGGDQFILLLPDVSSRVAVKEIARKIIRSLQEPFMLGEQEVFIGVSMGISMFPDMGETVDGLIQCAGAAMYHVKGRNKDGYQFFADRMSTRDTSRLTLERDLRMALDNGQLQVHYQPQVNALSGEVIGVEALVRWHHPQKGMILPSEFLPIAEEAKLIADISDWVLGTACQEIKAWIDAGHTHIRLAVNLSPRQFEHPKFVPLLQEKLKLLDFPPCNLELEITENAIMSDVEGMIQKLNLLADMGVSVAIDDFGTGYSSLSQLRKLPIHTLKVDQSFVHDLRDHHDEACIVNAIVAMAQGLKLNIVAEGVETENQYTYLKQLGCHEIQGFYFGRAEPAEAVLRRISRQPTSNVAH